MMSSFYFDMNFSWIYIVGLKGNPLTQELLVTYNEPNGTQKLLSYLLDNLAGKSMNWYILLLEFAIATATARLSITYLIMLTFTRPNLYFSVAITLRNLVLQIAKHLMMMIHLLLRYFQKVLNHYDFHMIKYIISWIWTNKNIWMSKNSWHVCTTIMSVPLWLAFALIWKVK